MSGQITRRMHAAIAALLTCTTETDAAEQIGISVATLRRWKSRPEFRDALRAASRAMLDETVARLRADAEAARRVLRDALDDPGAVRVRAAIAVLTISNQIDVDELARRVEALEARQEHDG